MTKGSSVGVVIGVSGLALLLLGGVGVAAYAVAQKHKPAQVAPAPTAGTGTAPAAQLPPIGAAPVTGAELAAQLERERRARELEGIRVTLNQKSAELAGVNNEMDRLSAQLENLRRQTPDPALVAAVTDREWAECRNEGPWISQAFRCTNSSMSGRIQTAVTEDWGARQQVNMTPLQNKLSELDAKKRVLVTDIQRLQVAERSAA